MIVLENKRLEILMNFLAKRNIAINWFFFDQFLKNLIENTFNYITLKYQKNVMVQLELDQ